MKKFIFLRFGIGVFDERWYEHRIKLFETITLPSLENLEHTDDLRIFLITDSCMPLVSKRKLIKSVCCSKIGEKIFIRSIDYIYELVKICRTIVNEYCENNEFAVISRLDIDDALPKSVYVEIEDFIKLHKNEPALITFPNEYNFFVEEKSLAMIQKPFHSLNTFWITDNREYTPYDSGHFKQSSLAGQRGINVYQIDSPVFLYTVYTDSALNNKTSGVSFHKRSQGEGKVLLEDCFDMLHEQFGFEQNILDDYYQSYPETPDFGYVICLRSKYYDVNKQIRSFLKQNKEQFIDYRSKNKATSDGSNAYYNLTLKWFDLKLRGINIESYLLSNTYKNVAIYGIGTLGQLLYSELKNSRICVKYYVERDRDLLFDGSLLGYKLSDLNKAEKVDLIIVTPFIQYMDIKNAIDMSVCCKTISLDTLIEKCSLDL